MKKIKIVCVGKIKEKFLKKGIDYYSDKFDIIEIADEKAGESLSDLQKESVKNKEGEKILKKINKNEYIIILDIIGKELTTEQLKKHIKNVGMEYKVITFVIGGSLGISDIVKKRANFSISFSKMTFPHQLMRLILVEQISKININKNSNF